MERVDAIRNIVQDSLVRLEQTHVAREVALPLSRQVIHACAAAIRAAHRHEYQESNQLLREAHKHLQNIQSALVDHSEIYFTGYVSDAQKEFAEAHATLAFLSESPLPGPRELHIEVPSYLNGLAEAASELRRTILDALRKDDVARCEGWMAIMDEIYSFLVTVDYPEAITGGLRRTTDQLRGVLERTRGDLTLALRQRSLEEKLAQFQSKVSKGMTPLNDS